MKKKTRSSRFSKEVDNEVLEFSESLTIDIVLLETDIKVTTAHVEMLAKCKLISKKDLKTIISGLKKIREMVKTDKFPWSFQFEDVHMNIENALSKLVGDVGKKIKLDGDGSSFDSTIRLVGSCRLSTSDAADEGLGVDQGRAGTM